MPQPVDAAAENLRRVREDLAKHHFAFVTDAELGLPVELRSHIAARFFTDEVLEGDHPAVHQDRDRARDVIRYTWSRDGLTLKEHDEVEIRDRSGFAGTRSVTRVWLLDDPHMRTWIETVLALVPSHLRQEDGTFGVNFFRTRNTVVAGPHQDDEEYVLVYVVDKCGGGAESTLHNVADPEEIIYKVTLEPGDLLIFRDDTFLHSVSPLTATGSAPTRRDAIVCTVNYPDTYALS
jgi:hypothetical protein